MKLLSIASLAALLAAPASALLRSSRHPTKEDRRLARKRNTDNGHRRLAMEDCPGATPAFLKFFRELTDAEIIAAAKLGYSSEMWDDDDHPQKYDGATWEELSSDAQANFMVLGIDKQVFDGYYSSIFWGELDNIDPALTSAAATLGYTKEIWNTCYHSICTAVQEVSWFDLTAEQQSAAGLLGHTCHTWEYWLGPDNMDWMDGVDGECVMPYYERKWKGLPVDQKKAAELLGYTETTWDGNTLELPDTWDDLSYDQQALCAELGYTEAIYNQFFFYNWDSLPSAVQTSAQILDLNKESWDGCHASKLSGCTQLAWGDLTLNQKTAAGDIGVTCDDYDE